ncbi:MAG: 50S ribosomal protein L30 [Fibrobacterota bacterium]
MAESLKITQIKGRSGRLKNQLGTLDALGLKRIRHTVTKKDCPEVRGMINIVKHLVTVEEI